MANTPLDRLFTRLEEILATRWGKALLGALLLGIGPAAGLPAGVALPVVEAYYDVECVPVASLVAPATVSVEPEEAPGPDNTAGADHDGDATSEAK